MDLIRQNKLIGWIIGILVGLNILTLTLIWIQSRGKTSDHSAREESPPASSAGLLRSEIGFTEEQVRQYGEMRKDFQEKTRGLNDELTDLKLQIADSLFVPTLDEQRVDSMASRIGTLQSRIEILRFEHFRELVKICSADQKEKLRPVLREVFGRKPPQEKPTDELRQSPMSGEGEQRPVRSGDRPGPPRIQDKLERYAQQLSLTKEQFNKVEIILRDVRKEEEAFKSRVRPTEDEFEREKEMLRKKEDRQIMEILDTAQRREFDNLIRNRGKEKPREDRR